jgi:SMC interacting uncharacterized protein involved in chromosome segregation
MNLDAQRIAIAEACAIVSKDQSGNLYGRGNAASQMRDECATLERELTALTAERDQLRAELATERARLDYVLKNDCAWNDRSEIDQDIKNMSAESKK